MADKRITEVDFIESLDGSETFFVNQNGAIKQASRGNAFKNVVWSIANGGTGATDAAAARSNLGITPANIGAQTKHTTVTASLSSGGWSSNKQTVSVSGVTANNTIFVSPAPASYASYTEYGVYCSAQASGKLTFTCDSTPNAAITVNVVIFG